MIRRFLKFVPWRARYSQSADGTWHGRYDACWWNNRGSFLISGADDELAARDELREFVLWDEKT